MLSKKTKSQTAPDPSRLKLVNLSAKTQWLWHHAVDKKHYSLHVKFEGCVYDLFHEKIHFQQKTALFTGDGLSYFPKAAFQK